MAADAGARVVSTEEILPAFDDLGGKGDALWRSVFAAEGDIIVWCDADIRNFGARFVLGLVGPLLTRSDVGFVKGYYDRPLDGRHGEGGRVTELVARPLVSLFFPHLSTIMQPLAGEYAGRREILEQLPFATGYGVDLALLIDISANFGMDVIAQVDLGTRVHRNRTLEELSPQAMAIMQTVLSRAPASTSPTDCPDRWCARAASPSWSTPLIGPRSSSSPSTADAAPDAGDTLPPWVSSSPGSPNSPRGRRSAPERSSSASSRCSVRCGCSASSPASSSPA